MEHDEKLLDHNYDGIQELDNSLPPWWLNLFYITIIWGLLYVVYYEFMGGPSSIDEYNMEMGYVSDEASTFSFGYRSPYAESGEGSNPPQQPAPGEAAAVTPPEASAEEAEVNYELVVDATRLENGAKVFAANCLACHASDGGGGIGPNLTDAYWINGDGSLNTIVKVIEEGVPVKGMISWKPILSKTDILDVASHIYNLKGTTPAVAKEAQGEKYGE